MQADSKHPLSRRVEDDAEADGHGIHLLSDGTRPLP